MPFDDRFYQRKIHERFAAHKIDFPFAEGITAAKARGVKLGRPTIDQPENYSDVRDAWQSKKISARTAGKLLGVNHQTFLKWARSDVTTSDR